MARSGNRSANDGVWRLRVLFVEFLSFDLSGTLFARQTHAKTMEQQMIFRMRCTEVMVSDFCFIEGGPVNTKNKIGMKRGKQ